MSIGSSNLAGMPQNHREKLENGVKLLLLWVAASDGKLEEAELEFISSQFPDHSGTISNDEFLAVIRTADIESIEKAIRLVSAENRELRLAFIDMAVAMSMVDRDIAIAENHIVRFYADALHLGTASLEKRFQAIAGSPLQEPGDASSATWWILTALSVGIVLTALQLERRRQQQRIAGPEELPSSALDELFTSDTPWEPAL